MENKILTELPRYEEGRYKGKINWTECVGMDVLVVYSDKEYVVTIGDYIKQGSKVEVNWNNRKLILMSNDFLKCKLGKLFMVYTGEYKYDINENIISNNRNLTIIDVKKENGYKYYKIRCFDCGFKSEGHYHKDMYKDEYWIQESVLNNGGGCPCCNSNHIVVQGINDMYTTDYWMVKELGVDEEFAKTHTSQCHIKAPCKCPYCGKELEKITCNIYKHKSIGCSCGDGFSYLSKYIMSALKQLKINFDTEVKYDWNKYINPKNNKLTQASIDFVIHFNNREIPIEADGGFHRQDNVMNGQTKDESEYVDKQRDENCLKYLGEETIRITDEGDIKENVLSSKLSELFDLSKLDWIECNMFATKNLAKEVCSYWNIKSECVTVTDMASIFNISKDVIRIYLKSGSELGLCNYDPKHESTKASRRNNKYGKPIKIIKDETVLNIFETINELERQSEDLFGVKLCQSVISSRLSPNNKKYNEPYKGYTFKFVEDQREE